MLRLLLHITCLGFLLLLSFTSCRAQTVPRCEPAQPLPKNPRHSIVGLSFSRDGKTLVSAGGDGNIKFWDVATGQVRRTLSGHTNALYKAIFSPDEKLLASSSRDATARIWDVGVNIDADETSSEYHLNDGCVEDRAEMLIARVVGATMPMCERLVGPTLGPRLVALDGDRQGRGVVGLVTLGDETDPVKS